MQKIIDEWRLYRAERDNCLKGLQGIINMFYRIGGPLNDNLLGFDNEQIKYFFMLKRKIEDIIEDNSSNIEDTEGED